MRRAFLYEAMECLGGNGYVEDGILARHYREAPVNAIWEGSGNVMCLDVLRALSREPEAATAVLQALAGRDEGFAGGGRGGQRSSARLSAAPMASASRGSPSRSWRCWPLRRRSNGVSPRNAELFASHAPCGQSRQHVRRGGARDGEARALLEGRCRDRLSVIPGATAHRPGTEIVFLRRRMTTAKLPDGYPQSRPSAADRDACDAARLEILGHGAVGPLHLRRDVRRADRCRRPAGRRCVVFPWTSPRSSAVGREPAGARAVGHHGPAGDAAGGVARHSPSRRPPSSIISRCIGRPGSNCCSVPSASS